MERHSKKIKVTVITGFLGAGKTTFINQLLKKYNEVSFALVENEFGDVAIDTKLIRGVDASQMFELKKGCICCTISDEYELILQELAERFPDVEHLLIETTGIADPANVIRPFFNDENLKKYFAFNGTVALADGKTGFQKGAEEITQKQLAAADFIVVTKTEGGNPQQKNNVKSNLTTINPLAQIGFSYGGVVDDFDLFNFQNQNISIDFGKIEIQHSKISSKTFITEKPFVRAEFERWLFYQLDVYKNVIYRVKGLICFSNEPYLFVLQGVGGSFQIEESNILNLNNRSELVFIGLLSDVQFDFQF